MRIVCAVASETTWQICWTDLHLVSGGGRAISLWGCATCGVPVSSNAIASTVRHGVWGRRAVNTRGM